MAKPEIRLKGFEGEWKRHTLEECLSISNERNTNKLFGRDDVLSVSDDFGVVNQIKLLGRSYAGADLSGYKVVRPGQVIYTKSPLRLKPFGIIKENHQENGIVSVLYAVYNTSEKLLSSFVDLFFAPSYRTNNYLLPLISKGAKNTINISDENALKGTIYIPIVDEQIGITDYFNSLDSMIQSTTKKIESLKKMKSASLASMFPQAGETTPRVRFKGFEGEWECVNFGSIITECSDKTTSEDEDVLLSSAIDGLYLNSELFNHFRGQSNIGYRKVKKNMLILSAQNLHLGNANVNLRFEHGIVSPAYKIYYIHDCNAELLSHWIKREETKDFFLNATTSGASVCRKNIVWEDLYKQKLFIPKEDKEQRMIALFFTCLDKQISLQEKRLEKLKQIKAACLDKMFV